VKQLIKKVRSMTARQRLILSAYAVITWFLTQGAGHLAGRLANAKAASLTDAGQYGFGLGMMFGLLVVPVIWDVARHGYRRFGARSAPAAE
jgi:hypothetical protein